MRVTCKKCGVLLNVNNMQDPFSQMLTHKSTCETANLDAKLALAGFEVDPLSPINLAPQTSIVAFGDGRNKGYSYRRFLQDRNNIQIARRVIELEGGRLPNANSRVIGESVKKVFLPNEGLVAAPRNIAFGTWSPLSEAGDYNNENDAMGRLGSPAHQETGGMDNPLAFFSYQQVLKDVTEDEQGSIANFAGKTVKGRNLGGWGWEVDKTPQAHFNESNLFRRVSLYGSAGQTDEADGFLFARDLVNTDVNKYLGSIEEYLGCDDTFSIYSQEQLIKNLWSLIHQMIRIHELLYLAKMVHGDMHAGNIKVIVANGVNGEGPHGIIVKAFDFGKAQFKKQSDNYTRVDLEYLIQKKAVSGASESFLRNTWRKKTSDKMVKHYPLHKALVTLAAVEGKQGRLNTTNIDTFIKSVGDKFLSYLGSARLSPAETNRDEAKKTDQISAISNAFEVFANRLAEQYQRLQ
ncbi:MAG: hypothetical protein RLZZ419_2140 [Pseudomonadota bacterium]